jgi:hypothetical protein
MVAEGKEKEGGLMTDKKKQLRCPKCEQEHSFVIAAVCEITVDVEGTRVASTTEWDSQSPCECTVCDYCGQVKDFRIGEQEKKKGS